VIPRVEFTPTVPATAPTCRLPPSEEISEEGFGYFRIRRPDSAHDAKFLVPPTAIIAVLIVLVAATDFAL